MWFNVSAPHLRLNAGRPSPDRPGVMTLDSGTVMVLAYLLVSMGVIIIFLVAVFVIGWFVAGCISTVAVSAEETNRPGRRGAPVRITRLA